MPPYRAEVLWGAPTAPQPLHRGTEDRGDFQRGIREDPSLSVGRQRVSNSPSSTPHSPAPTTSTEQHTEHSRDLPIFPRIPIRVEIIHELLGALNRIPEVIRMLPSPAVHEVARSDNKLDTDNHANEEKEEAQCTR